MTTTTDLTREELVERLRAWASGLLPLMAAVEFVAATGTSLHGMVRLDPGRAWLDVFPPDDPDEVDDFEGRIAGMSGGQQATWRLVRSLACGELDDYYWRLDGDRKAAFVAALVAYA